MSADVLDDAVDLGALSGLAGYLLRRAQLAVFEDFRRCFEGLDLRPAEFSLLLVVDGNPGLSQRRLATALGIRPPNLVGMVARLVARGLLDQRQSPRDRRATALCLTPAGRAVLAEAMQVARDHDRRVTEALSAEERRRLIHYLGLLAPAPG